MESDQKESDKKTAKPVEKPPKVVGEEDVVLKKRNVDEPEPAQPIPEKKAEAPKQDVQDETAPSEVAQPKEDEQPPAKVEAQTKEEAVNVPKKDDETKVKDKPSDEPKKNDELLQKTEVKTKDKPAAGPPKPQPNLKKRSSLSNLGLGQDREYFIENLSMLLVSGMNIVSALDAIKNGVKSKVMKKIIEDLKTVVDEGSPIWKALDNTGLLSEHAISLIRIGEESGRLPANLKVISIQNQKEKVFKSKIISALLYPVAVLMLTLVVGIGIAWFILPKLTNVFNSLNMKLPVTTKILIAVGNFLSQHGPVVVPSFIFLVFFIGYFVFLNKKTRFIGQAIIFATPGVKTLVQQIELSKLGFILGNLLDAGMPLVDALDSLREVSTFIKYQKFYVFLKQNVEEGNTFQKCFEAYHKTDRLVPYPVQQMIIASEQSGNLKETLLSMGEMYEEKSDISTKNLSTTLEPILLFVIWLVVLFVALSVIMPIYQLTGGFNSNVK